MITSLYDAPGCCVLLYIGGLLATAGGAACVDSSGQPACIQCGSRLSRCKGQKYRRGMGHICQRCRNSVSRPAAAGSSSAAIAHSAVPAAPREKKRRRAQSDPGQPLVLTHSRLRVRAAKPSVPDRKKTTHERDAEMRALLEETHARRMAALTAAAAGPAVYC